MAAQLAEQIGAIQVNETSQPAPIYGMKPLAAKKPKEKNVEGTPVDVITNIKKLTISKNLSIFKYSVKVIHYYKSIQYGEKAIEISKSTLKGKEHEQNKEYCHVAFLKAIRQCDQLKGGNLYYDRQASLFTFTRFSDENEINITLTGSDICSRDAFIRCEFSLKKVDESFQTTSNDIPRTCNICPALIDRTPLEALNLIISCSAIDNPNVYTNDDCTHYLYNTDKVKTVKGVGGKTSVVGVKTSVKTLEGAGNAPCLYLVLELKNSFFHPNNTSLLNVLSSYPDFKPDIRSNSTFICKNRHAFVGMKVTRNYGKNKSLGNEGAIVNIRGVGLSAAECKIVVNNEQTTVEKYFKDRYNIVLKYPKLFTIEARGKFGNSEYIPVELLNVCNFQIVTTEQMSKKEQESLIALSAAKPHLRRATTEAVAKEVGLLSSSINEFLKVADQSERVKGVVLPKPTILFGQGRKVDWGALARTGNKKPDTDFMDVGQFFQPAQCLNWEVVFNEGGELEGAISQLVSAMTISGMKVQPPKVTFIRNEDLKTVFENAKAKNCELLVFITDKSCNYHLEIKSLEQKFQILTQDIGYATAEKLFFSKDTKKNIVNKLNMKLGGINYVIETPYFKDTKLVIGFESSQFGGLNSPTTVGYSANMSNHFQKFTGGYHYVKRSSDVYGPILKDIVFRILTTLKANKQRARPQEMFIYFSGVTEGQFAQINEVYMPAVKDACRMIGNNFQPHITLIAATKKHIERFFGTDPTVGICNLKAGTAIYETVVSSVLSEFYLASAVARQGTIKTTKFTIVSTTNQKEPLYSLMKLTNDLCFLHEIIYHPVGLPPPLYLAGELSKRGAKLYSFRVSEFDKESRENLEFINQELGYSGRKLAGLRFNA